MNILLVVNDSPWGSTLALGAMRLARAAVEAGHRLDAVFFRGEGVYNAMGGTATDSSTPDLAAAWTQMASETGARLMVCQSSANRRLNAPLAAPFHASGLAEFIDRLLLADRVVTL